MSLPIHHWNSYRHLRAMDPDAAEGGRLMAAHAIAENPEARQRVEDAIGVSAARAMYPEAYRSGFGRLLDRARELIKW